MAGGGEDFLDLSHLTEGEKKTILDVLLRDMELRRQDEGRVRTLEENVTDPVLIRSLSGKWFDEERNKRYSDRKRSCDLVHASIRLRKSKGKDVRLSGLFNGQTDESSPPASSRSSPSPRTERRLEGGGEEEEEKGGSQERITPIPIPTPRTKSLLTKRLDDTSSNTESSYTEHISRTNGLKEEAEDETDGHDRDRDTDSVSSGETEADPTPLKTSISVTSLQSGGYTLSGSMMSLFSSGEFGTVEVKGRIQFSLVYDAKREELRVRVSRCEELAAARKTRSDPYVKAYLLPDKSSHSKKKTSVKKKTLNPVYDETLKYHRLRAVELRGRTLNLSVWHAEPLGRNVFLGEVELTLALWDWSSTQPLWYELQPRVQMSPETISSRGNILLSIKFTPAGSEGGGLPQTGELHIWLREAQSLFSKKGGIMDSFVKSYILPDASQSSGQKTRMVKRSISPTYNHTMVYDGFQTSDLNEACAELTVWQREGLKTYPLGGIRLSPGTGQSYGGPVSWMDSTEEEVAVWTSMIRNPNHWIDTTLPIRTDLAHRTL